MNRQNKQDWMGVIPSVAAFQAERGISRATEPEARHV